MPTVFKKCGEAWLAEVPCELEGACALHISDMQTDEFLGVFQGDAEGGMARFKVPPLTQRRAVRIEVRQGARSLAGICSVVAPKTAAAQLPCQTIKVEVAVAVSEVQAVMPGLMLEELRSREDLPVSPASPMFAMVAARQSGLESCRLLRVLGEMFVFECEVRS